MDLHYTLRKSHSLCSNLQGPTISGLLRPSGLTPYWSSSHSFPFSHTYFVVSQTHQPGSYPRTVHQLFSVQNSLSVDGHRAHSLTSYGSFLKCGFLSKAFPSYPIKNWNSPFPDTPDLPSLTFLLVRIFKTHIYTP